ncbi:hypothetical protein [Streptomyces sp. NPDC058579]|uniref:ApeA N-terminal domain 1-containing protein n=1 Tax=Streptomyces sp. NPDC058579 TaxID=3346548 RepID=UPI00366A3DBC
MVIKNLRQGDALAGLLIDGAPETPYVGATLTYDEQNGIRIEVPFLYAADTDQFDHVRQWFTSERPPRNLQFVTNSKTYSLFGCRYAGHTMTSGSSFTLALIQPQEVVSGIREGNLADPLEVREFYSDLDGLAEWTNLRSVRHEARAGEDGRIQQFTITAGKPESIQWMQGEAQMELRTGWFTGSKDRESKVEEWVTLGSAFDTPVPLDRHFIEHRKVSSFLKFLFGGQVAFRKHRVSDYRFASQTPSSESKARLPPLDLISRRTFKESSSPKPSKRSLLPLAPLAEVGIEGLESWARSYDQWGRFIHPAESALSRQGDALENNVISFSMSLEAAGHLFGAVAGEEGTLQKNGKATTSTYSYRCISSLGIDCEGIAASTVGLAKALSNNYNTIKHFDRGEFPDPTETYLVSEVLKMTSRLIALRIANLSDSVRESAARRLGADVKQAFAHTGRHISDSGQFVGTK